MTTLRKFFARILPKDNCPECGTPKGNNYEHCSACREFRSEMMTW